MKSVLSSTASPTFTPGAANAGTLNFATAVASYGFQFGRLLGIINLTQNAIIYTAGVSGFGGAWNNGTSVLTLAQATTGMGSGDVLEVIWDDPAPGVALVAPTINSPSVSTYKYITTASTNATVVKASPGILSAIYFNVLPNPVNATSYYLRFYDIATTPTVGSTSVKLTFATTFTNIGGSYSAYSSTPSAFTPPVGIKFSNGIAFSVTTGSFADTDTAATSANTAVVNVLYV